MHGQHTHIILGVYVSLGISIQQFLDNLHMTKSTRPHKGRSAILKRGGAREDLSPSHSIRTQDEGKKPQSKMHGQHTYMRLGLYVCLGFGTQQCLDDLHMNFLTRQQKGCTAILKRGGARGQ